MRHMLNVRLHIKNKNKFFKKKGGKTLKYRETYFSCLVVFTNMYYKTGIVAGTKEKKGQGT